MEQQFLSVDSLLDPQLHNNIQQGRMINNSVGNNNGGMVSGNNNDTGENSGRPNANMAVGHTGPSGGDGSNHRVGGHGDSHSGGDGREVKNEAFELSNPSNPAIATAQAMLNHDASYPGQYLLNGMQGGQIPSSNIPGNQIQTGQMPGGQLSNTQMAENQLANSQMQGNLQSNLHMPQQMSQLPVQQQEMEDGKLMAPIPPLHIQQQIVNNQNIDESPIKPRVRLESDSVEQMLRSSCTRCKKEFDQPIIIPQSNDNTQGPKPLAEPKIYKLCQHCRDLQRKRSRRWQKKTKDKSGACRRCGLEIPADQQKFVLCPSCRENLRTRKANRAAQGKCVHCSGPLDASIITGDDKSAKLKDRVKSGNFKVCQRCRENDKIRRTNLERRGHCNRCAKTLDPADIGKHKVCVNCRTRKKRSNNSETSTEIPLINNNVAMMPNDQATMAMLSNTGNFVPQAQHPISQQYNPQQYVQVPAQNQAQTQAQVQAQQQYNQAIAQQQAFNQAMAQAQAQAQAQNQQHLQQQQQHHHQQNQQLQQQQHQHQLQQQLQQYSQQHHQQEANRAAVEFQNAMAAAVAHQPHMPSGNGN